MQVFKLNPQGPTAARTVPQPFKLSGLARLEVRGDGGLWQGQSAYRGCQARMLLWPVQGTGM